MEKVSKESKNKKRLENSAKQKSAPQPPAAKHVYTMEERAAIVRDRLANRPVFNIRNRNGKLSRRFIFTIALMVVAFAAALYFLSRW